MAQTLEYNKNVTAVVPVTIPTFDDDLKIIQALDDEPNDVGGMTAAELKAKFDEGNITAQQYINDVLIPTVIADDLTEQNRQAAEAERVANEIERVTNEQNRETAEAEREQTEQDRVAAENSRVSAETARDAAEKTRASAETERISREQSRATNEEGRISAENARKSAETARVQAETARVQAEQARVNAEASRAQSEQAREEAERNRVNSTTGIVAQATTQAVRAEQAAENAAEKAAQETVQKTQTQLSGYVSAAQTAKTGAEAAQRAAEQARDEAQSIVGGDFVPSTRTINGKALDKDVTLAAADVGAPTVAEMNKAIAAIPTPDVSGQISTHNANTSAHADIRSEIATKAPMYTYGTDDLEAGVTPLESGKLHFVYE